RFVAERSPLLGLIDAEAAHVLDVRTGDECLLPRAREDHDSRANVFGELGEAVAQLGQRRHVERVHRLLAIDRDDCEGVFPRDADQAGTFPLRKSTTSVVGTIITPGPFLVESRRSPTSAR